MGLVIDSKNLCINFVSKYRLDQKFPDTIYYNTYIQLMEGLKNHRVDLETMKSKKKELDKLFDNLTKLICILDQWISKAEENNYDEFVSNILIYLKKCRMFDIKEWEDKTKDLSNSLSKNKADIEQLRVKCLSRKNDCDYIRAKVLGAITIISARSSLLSKILKHQQSLFNDPSELSTEIKTVSSSSTSGEMVTYTLYHYKSIPDKQFDNPLDLVGWWSWVPYKLYNDDGFFNDNESIRVGSLREN